MAFFSPPPRGKKVAPLPPVQEENNDFDRYVVMGYNGSPNSVSYGARNMYRPGFKANDPLNAAAAARRAATLASMSNPNIGPRARVVAGAGSGGWGTNAPAPRPTIAIPNNSNKNKTKVNTKGGSRRHRTQRNTRRR